MMLVGPGPADVEVTGSRGLDHLGFKDADDRLERGDYYLEPHVQELRFVRGFILETRLGLKLRVLTIGRRQVPTVLI